MDAAESLVIDRHEYTEDDSSDASKKGHPSVFILSIGEVVSSTRLYFNLERIPRDHDDCNRSTYSLSNINETYFQTIPIDPIEDKLLSSSVNITAHLSNRRSILG